MAHHEALMAKQRAYEQERLEREKAFFAKIKETRTKIMNSALPPDVKDAELAKLDRILADYERDLRELDRQSREQDMIDAQRDLADAIRDLSNDIEQYRY